MTRTEAQKHSRSLVGKWVVKSDSPGYLFMCTKTSKKGHRFWGMAFGRKEVLFVREKAPIFLKSKKYRIATDAEIAARVIERIHGEEIPPTDYIHFIHTDHGFEELYRGSFTTKEST